MPEESSKSENIRELILSEFEYLILNYGFFPTSDLDDTVYYEVRYHKNDWTVSIKTIAHGTKISLSLISPQEEIGFLSHLFPKERNSPKSISESIKLNSVNLKKYGASILVGNLQQNETMLNELIRSQLEFAQSIGGTNRGK